MAYHPAEHQYDDHKADFDVMKQTQLSLASSPTLEANPKLGGNIWNIKLKGYTDCALNIINMFFLSALRVTKVTVVRNVSSVTLVFADTLSETPATRDRSNLLLTKAATGRFVLLSPSTSQ